MKEINRKMHRPLLILLASILAAALLAGCGSTPAAEEAGGTASAEETANAVEETTDTAEAAADTAEETADTADETADAAEETTGADDSTEETAPQDSAGTGTLVVYFSRTGEQYVVGEIEKGNTAIVAEMIAEETGADLFEVLPEEDYYPYTYDELTEVAKQEQNENARPAYQGNIPDLSKYDTVFIGAPVWWGDWPMIMYTFFENEDLSGKTLIPFSTHEGSGLSGFDSKLAEACPDADVAKGLAIRGNDAQNDQESVRGSVSEWISALGLK